MPRNAPTPLGAEIVSVHKGAARPLGEKAKRAAPEPPIGITTRLPEACTNAFACSRSSAARANRLSSKPGFQNDLLVNR